jgi:SAM-dependent methyltransferase
MRAQQKAVNVALRAGKRVRDTTFDAIYPEDVRRVSARFWTPVEVARTAARWLSSQGAEAILDVGSGAGKFCIVASLTAAQSVTGLEQRSALLEAAAAASKAYGARADFKLGTLETLDPGAYDAFYLFNPFGENLYPTTEQFDSGPELSRLRYSHDLSIFENWLDHAATGTCVVTYHGFGGRMPDTYDLLRSLPKGSDILRLWKKTRAGRAEGHILERSVVRVTGS